MSKFKAMVAFLRQPFQAVESVEARITRIKAQNGIFEIEKRLYQLEQSQQGIIEQMRLDRDLNQAQAQQIRDELQQEITRLQREKQDIVKHSRKRGKTATGLFSTLTDGDAPPNLRRKH